MKKSKKIRDLIYVSGEHEKNYFCSYGIEFLEFMDCVHHRPENLILLKHDFHNVQTNRHSRLHYLLKQGLDELIEENVYDYGDFCWVDFSKEEDLNALSNNQIAELLFFGHMGEPLHHIPKLRFAYFAHDDGWFNKLYVTDLYDYEVLLAKVIAFKLHKLAGRKVQDIPKDISSVLLEWTRDGLLIDLSKIQKNKAELRIPVSFIGHDIDMDSVYDFRKEIRDYKVWLVYSKKVWKLIKED